MKKILFLTGLVMAAVIVLGACSGSGGKKTKIDVMGETVKVDTFTANHYNLYVINEALKRDKYVQKVTKPSSAKDFGRRLSEITWKAVKPDKKVAGEVTILLYERGLEVVKDGKSWFYDFANISYDGDKNLITATESILYPGVWEPAAVSINTAGGDDIQYWYIYDCGCEEKERFYLSKYDRRKLQIKTIPDLIVSQKTF